MVKRVYTVVFIIIIVNIYLKAQNNISFFEEHIDFNLDNKFFSINGIYSFYNNSDKIANQQIIFPFAARLNLIDTIRIIDLNSLKKIQFKLMDSAIYFDISLKPKDTLNVNIFYRQITSNKNTYIITTTQKWGHPLDKAFYTLTAPNEMIINSFSYPPDSLYCNNDNKLYKWEKYHFSPKFDFDILINKSK